MPATKVTIKADLRRPMILNVQQQDSIETLADIDTADLPPDMRLDQMPTQPFRVPSGCMDRETNSPSRCRARCVGLLRVRHALIHVP